jgi:cytochrome c-type biogenesis protein CcmH/NrfG
VPLRRPGASSARLERTPTAAAAAAAGAARREAAILNPTNARALKMLGSALFGLGDLQAARETLQAALEVRARLCSRGSRAPL